MEGLYLYCVRPAGFPYEKKWAFTIPLSEIEAVVGKVDLDEFNSEEIQRKAQEDLNWIKEKSLAHESVIEDAMRCDGKIIPVIPMKLGTIFKSRERLETSLAGNYLRFKDSLARVKGKEEWGVKAYSKKECFLKWIEDNYSDIREKKAGIAKLTQGAAFFEQKKLNDVIDGIYFKELEKVTQDIFNSISGFAESGIQAKCLAKELTGKKEEMVFNAYFLVREERLDGFRKAVEKILEEYGLRGLQIACIGPLPHYHFI